MQSFKWAFLVLTLFAFFLNSCKKNSGNKPAVTNSIQLKFNGTAYSTSTIDASYNNGALQMIGDFAGGGSIYLAVPGNVKAGSFDFAANTASSVFRTGTSTEFIGDSGTITITSFTNNTVAGTFSFHGTDYSTNTSYTVTDGTFQTTYPTQ